MSETYTGLIVALLSIVFFTIAVGLIIYRVSDKKHKAITHADSNGTSGSNAKFFITLSSDAIVITDESLRILNFNEAFRRLIESEIVLNNQGIQELLRFSDLEGKEVNAASLVKSSKDDSVSHDGLYILNKANHKVEVNASIFRLRTTTSTSFVWKIVNASAQKAAQQQQSEFLSVISHELRTPVAVIEASTASLTGSDESLSPTQLKLISATRENTLLLSKLLADLSVYNTLQSSSIHAELSSVSPRMILDQMQKVFTSQADSKNIVLVVDHDQNVRNIISGESHILSIMQNYISNAIHFSEPGGVVIMATKAVPDGVVFMVRDTGLGIDADTQSKMFTNTFHANADTKHQTLQGAGVGLYISGQLAKSIGATVWVESQPQKGSTFYLKVPVSYETKENKTTVRGLEVVKFAQEI